MNNIGAVRMRALVFYGLILLAFSAAAYSVLNQPIDNTAGVVQGDDMDQVHNDTENGLVGQVSYIKGTTGIVRNGDKLDVVLGDDYRMLDVAETEDDSKLNISLVNESLLIVGGEPSSNLLAKEFFLRDEEEEEEGKAIFFLSFGKTRAISCEDRFDIQTPTLSTNAFGKIDYIVWEDETAAVRTFCIAVLEGSVNVENIDETIEKTEEVGAGQWSCVSEGKKPTDPETITGELYDKLVDEEDQLYAKQACITCNECEEWNPEKEECIFVAFKPCDDDNPCTLDDRCVSIEELCKGKKDPSPTDPTCFEDIDDLGEGNQENLADSLRGACNECEDWDSEKEKCVFVDFRSCNDNDPCTVNDRCVAGACTGTRDPNSSDPSCQKYGQTETENLLD